MNDLHPDSKTLLAYSHGQLDGGEAEAVDRHLAECDSCACKVDELSRVWERLFHATDNEAGREVPGPAATADGGPLEAGAEESSRNAEYQDVLHVLVESKKGRYRIEGVLGHGGMGLLLAAHDTEMRRDVAIKTIRRKLLDDPQAIARFRDEIQTQACVKHKNVVAAYDVFSIGEYCFMVLERITAFSLREVLLSTTVLTPKDVCRCGQEIGAALQAVWEHGIVHGDVKPENILRSCDGKFFLIDFGIARRNLGAEGQDDLRIMGTPGYMAPEQLATPDRIDLRTDMYGLGCTLYEALTGHKPRDNSDANAIPIRQQRPDIPEALAAVIDKLIERDPELRYRAWDDVVRSLKHVERELATDDDEGRKHTGVRWAWGSVVLVFVSVAVVVAVLLIGTKGRWRGPPTGEVAIVSPTPASSPHGTVTAVGSLLNRDAWLPQGHGLLAQIYSMPEPQRCIVERIDSEIEFYWVFRAPDQGMGPDFFTARWTGWLKPPSPGEYELFFDVDDGVRVWLDDQVVLDEFHGGPWSRRRTTVPLEDRPHRLRIEYIQVDGLGCLQFRWAKVGDFEEMTVPRECLFYDLATAQRETIALPVTDKHKYGLSREIYKISQPDGAEVEFKELVSREIVPRPDWIPVRDAAIDALSLPGVGVRWQGKIRAKKPGMHTFRALTDDGVRLWIAEVQPGSPPLIDSWQHRMVEVVSARPIHLSAEPVPIRIDYFNGPQTGASFCLLWELEHGFPEQPVPQSAFTPD